MPEQRAERKAFFTDAAGMPAGLYRVFALRDANGLVDPLHTSLAREGEPGTWHVLDRVPASRLVNAGGVTFVSEVVYDAQRERIAVGETVIHSGFTALRHLAEDLIVPGFSLLDRVGEAVRMLGNDEKTVDGTLVQWEGDHAIVQLASGELVALDEERSESLQGKPYDSLVHIEDPGADVEQALEGASLSRDVFGG